MRDRRVGQFRRILHEAWDDSENRILHWLERHTILCAGEPVGVGEAVKDRMLAFNAAIVRVAYGADDISGLVDAEQIGESEFRTPLQVFVVEAGLEAGHDRSAGLHVVADLLALAVAKHGDIRQQECAIFAEAFRLETVFVYEVKSETTSEQRFVDALRRLVHVCA